MVRLLAYAKCLCCFNLPATQPAVAGTQARLRSLSSLNEQSLERQVETVLAEPTTASALLDLNAGGEGKATAGEGD